MLSCSALEKSNHRYIESIVYRNVVFLRTRKRFSLFGFDWEENPKKWLAQWKKLFMR